MEGPRERKEREQIDISISGLSLKNSNGWSANSLKYNQADLSPGPILFIPAKKKKMIHL